MIDFKQVLAEKKPMIWKEIQKYLPAEGPYNFADVVNEYPRRQGKYGRGVLILLSCEAFGGDVSKAVRTAAAMQMSEDWLLIHDDFEDNSDERRNKPALHKIYGNEIAVNAGDALHLLMWKVLIDNRKILDEKTTFRVLNEFSRFLDITARGQHFEMSIIEKKPLEDLEYEDYENIIHGKAAEYTINGPLRLGAIIAGQSDEVLKKIDEVGIPLGKGFQIRDDLLNIIGEGSVYGKEIGGDIFEGKRTILLIHLIENTKGEEHKKVIKIMSKKREEKTAEEVQYIIDLMKKKGSVKFAEKKAEEFAELAKNNFNKHFSKIPNKEVFETAIDFFATKRKV
ncbi:polyprenyl synthetase family protein [Candidatus Woesearchaeota archaeon]|nr:polyprenyl synthetase family protein [Candidatus Woesearchaeota archaeon]